MSNFRSYDQPRTQSFTSLAARQHPQPQPTAKTLSSRDLFGGDREIGIEHHGALYRLKITRQGKLILNK
jgi:hemin uptake protein HemP